MKVAAVTLPKTSRELRVPTLVMFACEGFVTAPAVFEKFTVPERFATGKPDKAAPDPMKVAAVTLPKTSRELRVPTLVIFAWAELTTDPAVFEKLTVPERFATGTPDRPAPDPLKVPAVKVPKTSREVSVPTDVMLGCAPAVTLEATLADATLPTRFEELMFDKPEAFDAMSNPATVRALRTPTDVMFPCTGFVTLEATSAAATFPTRFEELRFEIPEPFEATSNPLTVKPVRVPTEVMLSCAGFVTLEATLAAATFPTKFEELMLDKPDAFPVKRPPAKTPETVRFTRVPSDVIFDWVFESWREVRGFTRFAELRLESPDAFPKYNWEVRVSTSAPPATVRAYPGLDVVWIATLPSGSMTMARVVKSQNSATFCM